MRMHPDMAFANMTAGEHRAYIMQAIKNRLDKHNNLRNKNVGG